MHEALLNAGVQFVDLGDGSVDVEVTNVSTRSRARMQVKTWTRPLGPTQIRKLATNYPGTRLLLIVPTISQHTLDAVRNLGWSWIAAPDGGPISGELQLPGGDRVDLSQYQDSRSQPRLNPPRGRKPWQRSAIERHLLLKDGWTQTGLVEVCQVTQPRVSQVLNDLYDDGLVARDRSAGQGGVRWTVANYGALFDRWLSTYPGPGGAAPTYWYGLGTISEQVTAVMRHLHSMNSADRADRADPFAIASGDAAADFLAPTRRSQMAVVYARRGTNLSPAGLTPAPAETSTLKLVVPSDTSLWPHPLDDRSAAMASNAPFPLADPIQVTWDLLHSDRPDAHQAAAAVRHALEKLRARDRWT